MAIVELREYKIKPNMKQAWLQWLKAELLPYQVSQGMRILHTYVHTDENGNDWFVWLREFDDEQTRQAIYQQTYNQWWKDEIRPRVFTMIEQDSIKVRLLNPVKLV
ncbi:hypothetical protein FX988_01771 [Paraglaciecola mesophila]|uniref:NIPSNAP domain-containing protein n=1 Tax=Paraglaciecola mesophila TaxID=197222 RepID=A0A857JKN9_9ALTE|nr:NIPSNAP family protein [Paraglaciecola mesophila]QHJ11537.1 hypothetical protein FX988_01771 [Paraglaciecola mesophila]